MLLMYWRKRDMFELLVLSTPGGISGILGKGSWVTGISVPTDWVMNGCVAGVVKMVTTTPRLVRRRDRWRRGMMWAIFWKEYNYVIALAIFWFVLHLIFLCSSLCTEQHYYLIIKFVIWINLVIRQYIYLEKDIRIKRRTRVTIGLLTRVIIRLFGKQLKSRKSS